MSLKEVICSEKIVKIKILLKEGFDIDDSKKDAMLEMAEFEMLKKDAEIILNNVDSLSLTEDSQEIADHVACYVAFKLEKFCKGCCEGLLVGNKTYLVGK